VLCDILNQDLPGQTPERGWYPDLHDNKESGSFVCITPHSQHRDRDNYERTQHCRLEYFNQRYYPDIASIVSPHRWAIRQILPPGFTRSNPATNSRFLPDSLPNSTANEFDPCQFNPGINPEIK